MSELIHQFKPDEQCLVTFYGDVNENSVNILLNSMFDKINKDGKKHVILLMRTKGGEIEPSIDFYNEIKRNSINLTTVNFSKIASAGINIFLAGKNRFSYENSVFKFHEVYSQFYANLVLSLPQLKDVLLDLEYNKIEMAKIAVKELGITIEQAIALYSSVNTVLSSDIIDKKLPISNLVHKIIPADYLYKITDRMRIIL